ncbi:MAG: outer membrane protein assembly factor BamD [Acidobacteriia bacterium]|nr:outer membrane protein assembly factor BamD [Terriglobia bacterium]
MVKKAVSFAAVLAMFAVVTISSGCRKHKYDNPITKDTQQPDKVLFDAAVDDIEHSRFERARLTLQTLMNTYDTSEYLAKSKLAIADSWFREGGSNGFAQAEAEYKDFILFYPTMEESAEAQEKICKMQYQQMDKSDRDPSHTLRAEEECKQVLLQFPNSKFAPEAQQMLRNVQEVLADSEYKVGTFYQRKGSFPAAANRLQTLADQFPLYSRADESLWQAAEAWHRMGDRFESREAGDYTKIVRDYPLSVHAGEAKAKLAEMKRPVPEADPVAYARMKYEAENVGKRSLLGKVWGPFGQHPNMGRAAKSGSPQMTGLRPTIPVSVPAAAAGALGVVGTTGVTAEVAKDPSVLDTNPDARTPGAAAAAAETAAPAPIHAVTRTGVDLNTATEAELAKLPGVGKAGAKRILQRRPYVSVQDLIRAGFSQKTINQLKPVPAGSAPPPSEK